MKPIVHARLSAKRYGGEPEDYLDIHNFMDSTKALLPDVRHRAMLHNSYGCFIAEMVFGTTLTVRGPEMDRALRKFRDNPTPENAEAYRIAKDRADSVSGKRLVSVRDIAEDHVREDLGRIVTLEQWLKKLPIEPWMAGGVAAFKKESEPLEIGSKETKPVD